MNAPKRNNSFLPILLLAFLAISIQICQSATYLNADGTTDTYELMDSVYGGTSTVVEVPDCNHTSFGPHITQVYDNVLNRYVFAFHSHIRQDDDRCLKFDRRRTEIKTNVKSGDQVVGYYGDRMTLSWNFKLDSGFLPPYSFCHIHQLKAVGGDDSMPLITLTTRRSNPNELQLLQHDSKGYFHFLDTVPLAPFLGEWIHATSDIVYASNGTYDIRLARLSDNLQLLHYSSNNTDFWRNETQFMRPKWGIYRSIQEAVLSRNETVLFDRFCVGVGDVNLCN